MRFALLLVLVTLLGGLAAFYARGRGAQSAQTAPQADPALLLPVEALAADEAARYQRVAVVPYDLPRYAFSILIPQGWRWRRFDLSRVERSEDDRRPIAMAEFGPPEGDAAESRVLLEARYVRVPEHVTLSRFIDVYAAQSEFTIVTRATHRADGVDVEEALLRVTSAQLGPYLLRLSVRRSGPLLFLVAGSALEDQYPRWRHTLALAALSFKPGAAQP